MSVLGKILQGVGLAAPFIPGVNVAAPYLTPTLIAVGQGLDNRDAANKATGQLQDANNQAIDVYKQTYQPYLNSGSQASNTLAGLMGLGPLPQQGASDAVMAPAVQPTANTRTRPEDAPVVGQAQARTQTPEMNTLRSLAARQPTQSSYRTVRMRSPDGSEEMDIPAAQVQHYLSRGAQVVN